MPLNRTVRSLKDYYSAVTYKIPLILAFFIGLIVWFRNSLKGVSALFKCHVITPCFKFFGIVIPKFKSVLVQIPMVYPIIQFVNRRISYTIKIIVYHLPAHRWTFHIGHKQLRRIRWAVSCYFYTPVILIVFAGILINIIVNQESGRLRYVSHIRPLFIRYVLKSADPCELHRTEVFSDELGDPQD